jgi:hypothetical protein
MKNYDNIKVGHEVSIRPANYGYSMVARKAEDQSKLWVVVESKTLFENEEYGQKLRLGVGYIDNLFPENYFGIPENFKSELVLDGFLTEFYFMEHANGGHGNKVPYSSISSYIDDPFVKHRFEKRQFNRFDFSDCGEPERVDLIIKFRIQGPTSIPIIFELSESIWEEVIPLHWYSEAHAQTIQNLSKLECYDTSDEAIESIVTENDLFGQRLFPVLKAPKELMDTMKKHCGNFKSYSKVLMDDEFIYIGIRSKEYEIDTIHDIYKDNGKIIKDVQWDW